MTELALPFCAVCRTRVARVEQVFNPAAQRGLGGYTLIAHCHGERDVVDISDADLAGMVQGSLRLGVAFRRGAFIGRACTDAAAGEPFELDMRDVAFNAPRPYVDQTQFRYGPEHGATVNDPSNTLLNGTSRFLTSSPTRRQRTR